MIFMLSVGFDIYDDLSWNKTHDSVLLLVNLLLQ